MPCRARLPALCAGTPQARETGVAGALRPLLQQAALAARRRCCQHTDPQLPEAVPRQATPEQRHDRAIAVSQGHQGCAMPHRGTHACHLLSTALDVSLPHVYAHAAHAARPTGHPLPQELCLRCQDVLRLQRTLDGPLHRCAGGACSIAQAQAAQQPLWSWRAARQPWWGIPSLCHARSTYCRLLRAGHLNGTAPLAAASMRVPEPALGRRGVASALDTPLRAHAPGAPQLHDAVQLLLHACSAPSMQARARSTEG